jgi:hypothetical protein
MIAAAALAGFAGPASLPAPASAVAAPIVIPYRLVQRTRARIDPGDRAVVAESVLAADLTWTRGGRGRASVSVDRVAFRGAEPGAPPLHFDSDRPDRHPERGAIAQRIGEVALDPAGRTFALSLGCDGTISAATNAGDHPPVQEARISDRYRRAKAAGSLADAAGLAALLDQLDAWAGPEAAAAGRLRLPSRRDWELPPLGTLVVREWPASLPGGPAPIALRSGAIEFGSPAGSVYSWRVVDGRIAGACQRDPADGTLERASRRLAVDLLLEIGRERVSERVVIETTLTRRRPAAE